MKQKLFTTLSLVIAFVNSIQAQDSLNIAINADLVSKYVWRGMDLGSGVSLQPCIDFSYKGLTFEANANASLSQAEINEINLSLSYEVSHFTFSITDYYNTDSDSAKYSQYTTDHTFEFGLSAFISDDVPLTLSWNTIFTAGKNDEYNDDGNRMYSSYFNIAYDFDVHGISLAPAIGFNMWESQYYDKFGVLDITLTATKEIKLFNNYTLPIYIQAIASPALDKAYLVFGITF